MPIATNNWDVKTYRTKLENLDFSGILRHLKPTVCSAAKCSVVRGKKSGLMCDPVPDQHLLPAGQQDSGPQANFPYHYLQHQDEASTTCSSISSHDLEEETNNKKIFTKTREENNFRWGRGPKRRCSTSTTPILSSMLATEPSNFRQTGPVPPGTVIRFSLRFEFQAGHPN